MDAQALRGSLIAQRDAAGWYACAPVWRDRGDLQAALDAQGIAAALSFADRNFRGVVDKPDSPTA